MLPLYWDLQILFLAWKYPIFCCWHPIFKKYDLNKFSVCAVLFVNMDILTNGILFLFKSARRHFFCLFFFASFFMLAFSSSWLMGNSDILTNQNLFFSTVARRPISLACSWHLTYSHVFSSILRIFSWLLIMLSLLSTSLWHKHMCLNLILSVLLNSL